MNTKNTRAKTLLVTAVGVAVLGIGLAAAPAAVAEKNDPNDGNHIPITAGDMRPQPAWPWQHSVLPPNKTQGGWK